MDDAVGMSQLLDLPKSFLAQVLSLCDAQTRHALLCVSKSSYDLCMELCPCALVCWGTPTAARLEMVLRMGGLRALLLPDSSQCEALSPDLQLAGLSTVVLNYRCFRDRA